MLILDKQNGIEGWQDSRSRDILFRKQNLNGKIRGGAHACLPVFGDIPAGKTSWGRYKLPRHGLFRVLGAEKSLGIQTASDASENTTKRFGASVDYPFSFAADESFCECSKGGLISLDHTLHVRRDSDCQTRDLMPVSIGWHPYFATYGEDFGVWLNNRPQIRETDRTDPAVEFDLFGQQVMLETKHHTFKFEFFGADNLKVWSDDKRKYVCFEPTSGTSEPHLLSPGHSVSLGTRITQLR